MSHIHLLLILGIAAHIAVDRALRWKGGVQHSDETQVGRWRVSVLVQILRVQIKRPWAQLHFCTQQLVFDLSGRVSWDELQQQDMNMI